MTRTPPPGILYRNKHGHNYAVVVAMALGEYRQVHDAALHPPREVHFNPAEKPPETSIRGLTVYANKDVRPGHIRVTACAVEEMETAK